MFNNFRGTIYKDVVSAVSGNNMCLVLSDVCIKHVSCGSMSCAATAQPTAELTGSSRTAAGNADSITTVDSNNISDTSELVNLIHLIKIIDIVDDNVNDYNVVNQRVVPKELNHLVPIVGSPRVCAQAKLVVMRAIRLVIRPPEIPTCPCLSLCMTLVVSFSSKLITRQIIARHLHTLIYFVILYFSR